MHKRYISCIKKKSCISALWLCLASSVTWAAEPSLAELAIAQVHSAVTRDLTAAEQAALQLEIRITGRRGAALSNCPSGWQLPEDLSIQHWRRLSIAVHCAGVKGSLVAQIEAQAQVWTLARDLPAGHRLSAQDLVRANRPLRSAEELLALSALEGLQLRRAMPAGSQPSGRALERPVCARRGQSVEIRASVDDAVQVSATGIAEATGRLGETGRVRNARSQRWVSGRWIAPGVLLADAQPGSVRVEMESND